MDAPDPTDSKSLQPGDSKIHLDKMIAAHAVTLVFRL